MGANNAAAENGDAAGRHAGNAAKQYARAALAATTLRVDALHDKAGRGGRFKTQAERDAHLRERIGALRKEGGEAEARAEGFEREGAGAARACAGAAGCGLRMSGRKTARVPISARW